MLYTATRKTLPMFALLPPRCPGSGTPAYRRRVEVYLERHRPNNMPSRLTCIFACQTPQHSDAYMDGELWLSQPVPRFLYGLQTQAAHGPHPMALVDAVEHALKAGEDSRAQRLAAEYWSPTQHWLFNEYLCTGVTVVAELQRQSLSSKERTLAHTDFSADRSRVTNLFP
jgi:hypothetical protein